MEDNMSDVINNFKTMLNNSNTASSSSEGHGSSSSNFNITPEMLSNLLGTFQKTDNSSNSRDSKKSNNSQNFNNIDSNNPSDSGNDFVSGIDLETIIKLKSVMETLNKKDDPRSNLLYSLKPYLRESRQKKLDQYVNLFKITGVASLFKTEKGDGS